MAAGSPQSGSLKKTGQKPRAFYDVALGGTFYHFRSILLVAGETCERWKVAGEGVMPEGRVIRVRPRPARLLPGTCLLLQDARPTAQWSLGRSLQRQLGVGCFGQRRAGGGDTVPRGDGACALEAAMDLPPPR